MSEREGVRITFTRRGGAEEFIEVFVPGAVTRTQRVIPPSEGPSPAAPPPAASAPAHGQGGAPLRVDIDQLNAARERNGLDSAEGSARIAAVIGEKATLAAIGEWMARTGHGVEGLCQQAKAVTLPPRRGGGR